MPFPLWGERKLRKLLPDLKVTSAGLEAENHRLEGRPADPVASKVAAESRVDLCNHKAKQITSELVDEYDVILVMDRMQLDLLCEYFPGAIHKAFLFSQWVGAVSIADPYRRGELAFRMAFNLIDDAAEAWAGKLAY